MSPSIVGRSPDLQRLHTDCYDIRITPGGLLVLAGVPYVTGERTVAYGTLVTALEEAGEATRNPVGDHSLWFAGRKPCDQHGAPLQGVVIEDREFEVEAGLMVQHRFSCKPADGTPYADYHAKMTAYIAMLMGHALALDPTVTATKAHSVALADDDPESAFVYSDTASARAGISVISDKLRMQRVAIVGVGGTGAYILDLIAKTPIHEIHLFDGDDFLNHNAFRAPGAASLDQLNSQRKKVDFFAERYSVMKRRIIPHAYPIDAGTVDELRAMDFVFLAAEGGGVKRLVVAKLEECDIPFIDVGVAVDRNDDALGGMVLVTTSTPTQRDHVHRRIDLSEPSPDDIYDNIQIADLNALNACLAVIRWKKLCGFYRDLRREHFAAYTIDANQLNSDDRE